MKESDKSVPTHKCCHVATVSNGVFQSYIQPILDLKNLSVYGYEILNRPLGIPTESFFDDIVSCGCYKEVDQMLVKRSIQLAGSFTGLIFINVFPSSIVGLNLDEIETENIVFEFNERQFIQDWKDVKVVHKKKLRIALDDLGKGGAGLQALIELDVQFFKIDGWLVSGIQNSRRKQELVRFLVSYSSERSKLIAEGIECQEELDTLKSLGVHYGQGYFLNRPIRIVKK